METEMKTEMKTYDFEFTSSYTEIKSIEALNFRDAFEKFDKQESGYGELEIHNATNVTDTDNPIVVINDIMSESLRYEINDEEYDENKLNEGR